MRKLYTEKEYSDMAVQANQEGKKLIKVQEEIDVPFEVCEYEKKTITVNDYDEETGEVIGHHTAEVDDLTKPIMVDEIDPETGETIKVHKHHTETRKELVERLEIVDGGTDNITMTALDFVKVLKSFGITSEEIHAYLDNNVDSKDELTFCQNVYCGVVKQLCPFTVGNKTITAEMVEQAFKTKNKII